MKINFALRFVLLRNCGSSITAVAEAKAHLILSMSILHLDIGTRLENHSVIDVDLFTSMRSLSCYIDWWITVHFR
jgi:hypothetical protein